MDVLERAEFEVKTFGNPSKESGLKLIAEVTRLRQLLSEAEKRLERAWIIPGPGNEYRMLTRPPAGDEAPSVAIVYRTLLSEER